MKRAWIYIALIVVGLALLFSPALYQLFNPRNLKVAAKVIHQASSGLTFDIVLNYIKEILGVIVTLVGIVQAVRSLKKSPSKKK